jgi:predicted RNA-binding protein (virulence factor B family)
LTLHEAFLELRDTTRFGAFVEWGLPEQLLVPFAERRVSSAAASGTR